MAAKPREGLMKDLSRDERRRVLVLGPSRAARAKRFAVKHDTKIALGIGAAAVVILLIDKLSKKADATP